MCKEYRVILLSIIFTAFFNIPIFYLKLGIVDNIALAFALEALIILPITILLFYILLIVPYIGPLLISTFCIIGAISNFFVLNFKKSFDAGVLTDILSVEASLSMEYINIYLVSAAIISFFVICFLIAQYINKAHSAGWKHALSLLLLLTMIVAIVSGGFTKKVLSSTLTNYFPFNIFYSIKVYNTKYKLQSKLLHNKHDLTKEYTFKEGKNGSEPLIVMLIIGESMRGDLVSKTTMPLLSNRPNVVNFSNAKSFTPSTRLSIPYMLTSASFPNVEQSLGEKTIISIFKYMGFSTSWIGNQGLFGAVETTFASMALEADQLTIKTDLEKAFPHENIHDGYLLPYFQNTLNNQGKKQFIVMHLLGSHWRFDQRLPKKEIFKRPFMPECINSSPAQCSKEDLRNSYYNSLYYSDIVIDQMLTKLEDKNAIVIYASDHGISLGENGYFCNAHQEENPLKEQLDIAMFTWASDKFIKNNPSYLNAQTHEQKPITHDYIFHSLLDCTGVQSEYIENKLSLCRKRF